MRRLCVLGCLLITTSLFAESLRYTSTVKGIQNEIVDYILTEDDLPYSYQFSYYRNFIKAEKGVYAAWWENYPNNWQEDENLSEWFEYAVKAYDKLTNAALAFGHNRGSYQKKIDNFYKKNKADKNGYYTRLLYNPGEILDGYYVLLEEFFTWDNNSKSSENRFTIVQIKKSSDFTTYLD